MPKVSRHQIAAAVAAQWVEKSTNRKDLVSELAALMIEDGRKEEVELVVNDVKSILFKEYGIAVTDVYSKSPLTKTNKQNITELIKSKLELVKKVVINEFIDESILGGALILSPELTIDLTFNKKLSNLRNI